MRNSAAGMRYLRTLPLAAVLLLAADPARAGPPYVTDDPEPVEFRHWEFYLGSQVGVARGQVDATAPHVEVNYGVAPDVQLHLIAPAALSHVGGRTRYGFGDLELGMKLRYVHEDGAVPMIGLFPLLEIPTGNASRGLGNGAAQLFLPLWLQKSWGRWQTYGGGGYGINWARGGRNWWFVGWQAQYAFPSRVTLGAEVYYATARDRGSENDLAFDVGLVFDITGNHHLLVSGGRDLLGSTRFQGYLAYQWTFGPKADGK
jgi:hypothetical protein